MPFSAQKMDFFDKNGNLVPWPVRARADVKELFFPLIFFYLNSEGFVGGRWRRWWNSPLNIFNLAKKWTIFGRFEKNVVKKYWNPIHRVCVTQIHHDTWFLTQFFMKMPQFLVKTVIFIIFKNPHFLLFSGVLEVKLKFQDKFYNIIDYNKYPSSEKEDEKGIFRKSYFHQIQPKNMFICFIRIYLKGQKGQKTSI